MEKKQIVTRFWKDVAEQNADNLQKYFLPNAEIKWHDTNELFSPSEYIIANCEYPGKWNGEIDRIEINGDLAITVTKVWNTQNGATFYATSFFTFQDDKILTLDEYFSECGTVPQWRLEKKIGKAIKG